MDITKKPDTQSEKELSTVRQKKLSKVGEWLASGRKMGWYDSKDLKYILR